MKAVQLVAERRIEVVDVPDATLESSTDAVVRVTASAICGADLLPYHGHTPGFEFGMTPGHEFVGEVVDVGEAVGRIAPGDRVVNTSMTSCGACAHCRASRPTQCASRALFGYSGVYPRLEGGQSELVRVPLADRSLMPLPDGVSDDDAVFLADILPTGLAGVRGADLRFGDVLVVLGCGPVGLMAVLAATGTARTVVAVDGIAARRELATQLGAIAVEPGEPASRLVDSLTGGIGADAVVEASGSIPALRSALGLARPQGVVSVIGAHFEPDFPLDNGAMFEKELTLRFSVGNPTRDREMLAAAIAGGTLAPSAVLTHRLRLDDAAEAYRAFDAKEMTKVVLTP
jgi:alcohol dehydrogenase